MIDASVIDRDDVIPLGSALARWAEQFGFRAAIDPAGSSPSDAGRRCARAALEELGRPVPEVPRGLRGEPVWPPGVVGSISHTAVLAVAVVAPSPPCRAIGVDVEQRAALPLADAEVALSAAERAWAGADPAPDELATALWSVKEAVAKAWNTVVQHAVEPLEPWQIEVEPGPPPADLHRADRYRARVLPDGSLWDVRVATSARHVLALALPSA